MVLEGYPKVNANVCMIWADIQTHLDCFKVALYVSQYHTDNAIHPDPTYTQLSKSCGKPFRTTLNVIIQHGKEHHCVHSSRLTISMTAGFVQTLHHWMMVNMLIYTTNKINMNSLATLNDILFCQWLQHKIIDTNIHSF